MTSELILLLLWRKIKGFRCSLPVNVCKNTFCFTFFIVFHNLFSQGHRFTNITCTGSICNHSLKCGCHFSTLDINAHFRILFIANSNFLNCIRTFIRSNECSNSTKFVWALLQKYFNFLSNNQLVLHIFVDTNLRHTELLFFSVNNTNFSLVMAKAPVSLFKNITLPRLELMAALVCPRLCSFILP